MASASEPVRAEKEKKRWLTLGAPPPRTDFLFLSLIANPRVSHVYRAETHTFEAMTMPRLPASLSRLACAHRTVQSHENQKRQTSPSPLPDFGLFVSALRVACALRLSLHDCRSRKGEDWFLSEMTIFCQVFDSKTWLLFFKSLNLPSSAQKKPEKFHKIKNNGKRKFFPLAIMKMTEKRFYGKRAQKDMDQGNSKKKPFLIERGPFGIKNTSVEEKKKKIYAYTNVIERSRRIWWIERIGHALLTLIPESDRPWIARALRYTYVASPKSQYPRTRFEILRSCKPSQTSTCIWTALMYVCVCGVHILKWTVYRQ